ncbi:MAG: hypothetical protein AB4372_19410 [Xenococcus sp. (in: cyanobacteria)]
MKFSALLKLCLILSVVYISLGDALLPQPYSHKSKQVKQNINEYLVGLFPDGEFTKLRRTQTTMDSL